MAVRPPRVTSTRRQRTTRGGPVVTSTSRQPTTGRGRLVRQPANPFVSRGTLAGMRGSVPAAGTAAAGASAAPAAPAAPGYSLANLPPDASYDAAVASLQKQRGDQLAALTQQRTSGLSDYGFQEGPNGALTFDPNNPFSQAAVMKKAFDTNRRSTGQTMAAGGQQYSGAFQNAQDLVNRNQVQGEDRMQKALINFLARNTLGATQANTGYETAAAQAYGDRVSRFSDNPLYDPAASPPSAAGAAGGGSAAAPAAAPASRANAVAAMRRRARLTGARIGRI